MKRFLAPTILVVPAVVAAFSGYEHASVVAVFVSIVSLWFTEALPLAVTGLLVPILIALYSLMPAKEAFASFGSDILFLFIGCFLLARAMQKHGWDKRMAYWVLSSRIASQSSEMLLLVVSLIAWILSMWVSNTATCAMLAPICLGIISVFVPRFKTERDAHHFATRILLSCAFGSTMGGLATPVGTPPNLLAIEFLRDAGMNVSFVQWMFIGLPVSLAMLGALHLLLRLLFPIGDFETSGLRDYFTDKLSELGPLKREEIQVAGVFSLAVLLWVLPGVATNIFGEEAYLVELLKPFSLSVVGIGAALLLFFLPDCDGEPNLNWGDAKHIEWGTVLLFGGGISLGNLLNSSGLAGEVGAMLFSSEFSPLLLVALAAVTSLLMSEFASNTAAASVVYPILLGSVSGLGLPSGSVPLLLMASSFGASFGFMLPVSTPPNAIVYGTGKLKLKDMIKAGVCFDFIGFLIITAWISVLLYW